MIIRQALLGRRRRSAQATDFMAASLNTTVRAEVDTNSPVDSLDQVSVSPPESNWEGVDT
jgi:hypothetical protein